MLEQLQTTFVLKLVNKMIKLVLIGLILCFSSVYALPTNEDLCKPELCQLYDKDDKPYIAQNVGCNNDGKLSSLCSPDAELVDITQYIDKILHLHNKHRNKIASGDLDGFDTAARMPAMKWSPTLQYMAEFNAKRCNYSHDECRNTPKYPNVGQNIGDKRSSGDYEPDEDAIEGIFNKWWKENEHSNMNSLKSWEGGHKTGHFAQIARDRASEVGCSLIRFDGLHKGKMRKTSYFVCNYAMTLLDDQNIYQNGPAGHDCLTGTHANYPSLCTTEEKMDFVNIDM